MLKLPKIALPSPFKHVLLISGFGFQERTCSICAIFPVIVLHTETGKCEVTPGDQIEM